MSVPVLAVFVYGTLRRGEVREECWPQAPLRVQPATLGGELRDLGEYPALVAGSDMILGELWQFAAADIPATLARLDEIEWFGQDEWDLYSRRVVTCRTRVGEEFQAYSYWYANPGDLSDAPVLRADAEGLVRWSAGRSARAT